MNDSTSIPRWLIGVLVLPSVLACFLLAFYVLPNQRQILSELEEHNRMIEENRADIKAHNASIPTTATP